MTKYTVEKHVTWIVCAKKEGITNKKRVAQCDSQGIALTIAGMYNESEEREGEEGEKYE